MDSRQILYFKAVCDEGGFARAAAKLYITPQGISKAIHKLEEELGARLFETTSLGVRLTDCGEGSETRRRTTSTSTTGLWSGLRP